MSALCEAPGCCPAAECPRCLDRTVYSLSGVAASRGIRWAESVARRRPELLGQPWPCDERALAIARTKVDDLSSDPRAVEQLVEFVMRDAERAWSRLQPGRR